MKCVSACRDGQAIRPGQDDHERMIMMKKMKTRLALLLMCACLALSPAAQAYDPVIVDTTAIFYACMADLEYRYSETDHSYGNYFSKTFKDRATYAGYGWDAAYTFTVEGTGDEFEGRMTSMTYDAALDRTFAPGKKDKVLEDAYEIFISAAGMQFGSSDDQELFSRLYSAERMWQVLGRAMYEDFDPSPLSRRIGGWDVYVDVAYGDNEMHFYFCMSR